MAGRATPASGPSREGLGPAGRGARRKAGAQASEKARGAAGRQRGGVLSAQRPGRGHGPYLLVIPAATPSISAQWVTVPQHLGSRRRSNRVLLPRRCGWVRVCREGEAGKAREGLSRRLPSGPSKWLG